MPSSYLTFILSIVTGSWRMTPLPAFADNVSLLSRNLRPLPIFASLSEAERFVDSVAVRLGCPVRVESLWAKTHCFRELRYRDRLGKFELAAAITRGRLIEGKPSWSMKCTVTRLDAKLTMGMPPRLRRASFEKDARELMARIRSIQPKAIPSNQTGPEPG
jgi:hypothetical protein